MLHSNTMTGIPTSLYDDFFSVLDSAGLSAPSNMRIPRDRDGLSNFDSAIHPWVGELARITQQLIPKVIDLHGRISGARMIHERMLTFSLGSSPGPSFGWEADDPILDLRSRYGCIFPGRMLYLAHQITTDEDEQQFLITPDFIAMALNLRPLLVRGLALLIPIRIKKYTPEGSWEIVGSYKYRTGTPHIAIEGTGASYNDFLLRTPKADLSATESMKFLCSPLLRSISLEALADVLLESYNKFENYCQAVTRYFRSALPDEVAIKHWIEEVVDASETVHQLYEKKSAQLHRTGVETAMGLAISAAPFLIPGLPTELQAALSATVGSKRIYDGMKWLRDMRQVRNDTKMMSLWSVWSESKGRA